MRINRTACVFALTAAGVFVPADQEALANSSELQQLNDAGRTPARMQEMLSSVWSDAIRVWSDILGEAFERDRPQINFVPEVVAAHCYGLYISAGPVYCFGNSTVFVSLPEMTRLQSRISGLGDAGLAFLVAHELGHHVQKMTGRFRAFSGLVRATPVLQRELSLRFELEADCLAGVWANHSSMFSSSSGNSAEMLASLDAIGDDKVQVAAKTSIDPADYTHGSASQRTRWFTVGLTAGQIEACSVLDAETY